MAVTDEECRSWRCCKEGPSGIDSVYNAVVDQTLTFKFQVFEGLKLAEDPNGGRRLRSQVCCDLDCIAAQIKLAAAEKLSLIHISEPTRPY